MIASKPTFTQHAGRSLIFEAILAASADIDLHAAERNAIYRLGQSMGMDEALLQEIEQAAVNEISHRRQIVALMYPEAVGSFRATMRELADDLMLSSDTSVIVDSKESAMKEAGEIIQSNAKIIAELGELIQNDKFCYDISNEKITIFKSVGIAIEDLAAAIVLYESLKKNKCE
ncbi:unnamed protein product [Rotaria sp. Silwood1]|nr:unnamed protein product [Rotaria sp. Silwood1]